MVPAALCALWLIGCIQSGEIDRISVDMAVRDKDSPTYCILHESSRECAFDRAHML